jgi:hypothetical protein
MKLKWEYPEVDQDGDGNNIQEDGGVCRKMRRRRLGIERWSEVLVARQVRQDWICGNANGGR